MNIVKEFKEMIDWEKMEDQVSDIREVFSNAKPFEHVSIDGLFNELYLDRLLEEFENMDWSQQDVRNDTRIEVKQRSNWTRDAHVPPMAYLFIQLLNSGDFLRFLAETTGVAGLIPDPYLTGGGLNQIKRGGHLAVHADGNWHDLMGVHRRLNVILYLNKDWQNTWKGDFELWDNELTKAVKKVAPIYNRLMIFKTDDFSFHGHPEPLECPDDRSRRSLILYYYTNTRPDQELDGGEKHRALWKKTYDEI